MIVLNKFKEQKQQKEEEQKKHFQPSCVYIYPW